MSLNNLYKCWRLFKKGKVVSREIIEFEYYLEANLRGLQLDLAGGAYRHGSYRQFEVTDNKRRLIRVAPVRDRVVHRLIYECLKPIFDQTFIYDAWSCRENKGLIGAIKRSQELLRRQPAGYIWRADIRKFFDSVDKNILFDLIRRRIVDKRTTEVISNIIFGESSASERGIVKGIPIGNLTSQIFANIYLNELDRFIKHELRLKYYLRYGDDFIILSDSNIELDRIRLKVKDFLNYKLRLEVNDRYDIIIKASQGLKFLGAVIYPQWRRLNRRNNRRLKNNLNLSNLSSYRGLAGQYEFSKIKEVDWLAAESLSF